MFSLNDIRSGSVVTVPSGVHYLTEPVVLKGKNIRMIG